MKREKLDRLGEILQESVNKHEIAGGNLLVMHHGEEIYYAQAGMADIAQGKGIERDSLFRLYSMSKPVTSAAVISIFERELLICLIRFPNISRLLQSPWLLQSIGMRRR